jgi:hypothetical protein
MKTETVPVKMYLPDRNFLERIKRDLKLKSLAEAQTKIVLLFKRNKLHLDLK